MKQIVICSLFVCAVLFAAGCPAPSRKTHKPVVDTGKTQETHVETPETNKTKVEIEPQGSSVKLALKFRPEDSTTYRVALETDKSVQWEGQADRPRGFQGGHTGNKMEMTFEQRIQSVDDQGNATAKVTIKTLKYVEMIKNEVKVDFDSSRPEDQNSPLSRLIGQGYTVEIMPSGEILKVSDTKTALSTVSGDSIADKVGVTLLSAAAIKEQHEVPSLPPVSQNRLRKGESWSRMRNISFEMMGIKSYEKVYTLKEINVTDGASVAVVSMEAVPSAEDARQLHKEQATNPFSKMFDNTEKYTGELKLDLDAGKVQDCREDLLEEWFIVNPTPKAGEPPAALRMTATRLYHIEKLD